MIVVGQVGRIVDDEFYSDNFYRYDYEELVFRNPIVHYLVDEVRKIQMQNRLLVEGYSEAIDEITEFVLQMKMYQN